MDIFPKCIAILATVFALLPAATLADNSGWYIAADAGQSHFTGIAGQGPQWVNSAVYNRDVYVVKGPTTTYTDNDAGSRLSAGYQFNSYWGLEVSYVDLGQATAAGNGVVAANLPLDVPNFFVFSGFNTYNVNAKLSAQGWGLAVTGSYPFNDHWSVFARAGVIDARVELDLDSTITTQATQGGTFGVPPNTSMASTNWKGTYGLGVKWSFVDHWTLRLGLDRYANLGDSSSTGTYSVDLASLGIVYSF